MTEQQFQILRSDVSFSSVIMFLFVLFCTIVTNCHMDENNTKIDDIHKITVPQEKSPEQLKIEILEQEIKKLKEDNNETQTTN